MKKILSFLPRTKFHIKISFDIFEIIKILKINSSTNHWIFWLTDILQMGKIYSENLNIHIFFLPFIAAHFTFLFFFFNSKHCSCKLNMRCIFYDSRYITHTFQNNIFYLINMYMYILTLCTKANFLY